MKRGSCRGDRGSGSLLAVGIIGSTVASLALSLALYVGLGIHQALMHAADASALAAADVAAGIWPGSPCAVADDVATANQVKLDDCAADGLIVTVRTSTGFLGLKLTSSATAGPPVVVTN